MLFGYNFDRKTLYIIMIVLGILLLFSLSSFSILSTILTLPGVIIAISCHEFAHAWMANRLGDHTARNMGRMTLDPRSHLNPVGLILLIFTHIGWGEPVPVNTNNFTKVSRKTGEVLVSLAGPVMNFILAIIFTIIFYLITVFSPDAILSMIFSAEIAGMSFMGLVALTVYCAITVNIGLGVFNLIPIPPLDGSKIFLPFLPYSAQRWLDETQGIIYLIFILLWISGILGYIVAYPISWIQNLVFNLVGTVFSLFL